jgi:hypothetical protein
MRRLLAALAVTATLAATGCGGSHVTLLAVDSPEPELAVLRVKFRMTERMLQRASECKVVAEYAGHRGETAVPGGDQDFTRMSVLIDDWLPSAEAVDLEDRVRVSFLLGRKAIASEQFAAPFPARVLSLDGPSLEEQRQTDQRRPDAPAPAPQPSSAQTDLLQPDAQPATPAPCPVCTEPRGDVTPCPACGIE